MACSFPCRCRKFTFVLAHFADGAHLCCFAGCANPMKCRLWLCMFCHECVLLFPRCARHALPWLLRFYMPTNTFFAYPCCIFTFPAAGRERRRRLRFITFLALPFVSVLLSQRAPVHFFTSPEPQQQCTAYFCALLKRCCRERSVHKQTMPVLDTRDRNICRQWVACFADVHVHHNPFFTRLPLRCGQLLRNLGLMETVSA